MKLKKRIARENGDDRDDGKTIELQAGSEEDDSAGDDDDQQSDGSDVPDLVEMGKRGRQQ